MQAYKRRVFYEARIIEQELTILPLIVRLTISLHDVKETAVNAVKFSEQLLEHEKVLEEKKNFVLICNDRLNEYEQMVRSDKGFQEQEQRIKEICREADLDTKKINNFVRVGKQQCRM